MKPKLFATLLLALLPLGPLHAATSATPPAVEAVALADRIYSFKNTMAISTAIVGDEGVLLVDSGDKPEVAANLQAAIAKLTTKPVRLLVNTHWHYDHVNGNAFFAERGTLVIGHTRMRERVATQEHPLPVAAQPAIAFEQRLTVHFAGEELELIHPDCQQGHTSGDIVVYYRHANIVHMGDLLFSNTYPYIDVADGGWIDGMAAACREVLARIDGKTVVVPGHGPIVDKAGLEAFTAMLEGVSAAITPLVKAGKTLDEVKAAKPTAAFDAVWGKGWMKPDTFVELAYNGIVAHQKK